MTASTASRSRGRPRASSAPWPAVPPEPEGSTYGRWTWALYDRFECENLFRRYADAERWSVIRARERACDLLPDLAGRVVVLLGRGVQTAVYQALGADAPDFHVWSDDLGAATPAALAAIPHPSGLNRALNDPAVRERCGVTLRQALDLAAA